MTQNRNPRNASCDKYQFCSHAYDLCLSWQK